VNIVKTRPLLVGASLLTVAVLVLVGIIFLFTKDDPLRLDGVDLPEENLRLEIRGQVASTTGFCDDVAKFSAEDFAQRMMSRETALDSQTVAKLRQTPGAVAKPGQRGDRDSWLRFFKLLQEECR
jgi:hypothetical protein